MLRDPGIPADALRAFLGIERHVFGVIRVRAINLAMSAFVQCAPLPLQALAKAGRVGWEPAHDVAAGEEIELRPCLDRVEQGEVALANDFFVLVYVAPPPALHPPESRGIGRRMDPESRLPGNTCVP